VRTLTSQLHCSPSSPWHNSLTSLSLALCLCSWLSLVALEQPYSSGHVVQREAPSRLFKLSLAQGRKVALPVSREEEEKMRSSVLQLGEMNGRRNEWRSTMLLSGCRERGMVIGSHCVWKRDRCTSAGIPELLLLSCVPWASRLSSLSVYLFPCQIQ
jgi:hypothetical protein